MLQAVLVHNVKDISIHALCEEGDLIEAGRAAGHFKISIHALCEEGDRSYPPMRPLPRKFLSTPSARRATRCFFVFAQSFVISIHALCEEGDDLLTINFFQHFDFYPRPLRGGRHRKPVVPPSVR